MEIYLHYATRFTDFDMTHQLLEFLKFPSFAVIFYLKIILHVYPIKTINILNFPME